MTADEAKAAVIADQERRAKACGEAISAALKEFDCDLVAVPFIDAMGKLTGR